MGYAFISYSTKNQIAADSIRKLFQKNGVKTWMAPHDIPAGSKYAKEINRALKDCACLVLILTDDAQNSIWVSKEVERAINYHKTIITVQLENVILNDEFEFYISTDQVVAVNKIDENSFEIGKVLTSVIAYTGQENPVNTEAEDKTEEITVNSRKNQDSKQHEEIVNEFTEEQTSELEIEIENEDGKAEALPTNRQNKTDNSKKVEDVSQDTEVDTIGAFETYQTAKEKITILELTGGDTVIDDWQFKHREDFVDLVISEQITEIGKYAFYKCLNLETVLIPGSVKRIESDAFSHCEKLQAVSILNGVESIGGNAFYDCKNLQYISLPESILSIEKDAFWNCESLSKIVIPGSVKVIDKMLFDFCKSLEEVELGNGVEVIEKNAFRGCDRLRIVKIPDTVKQIARNSFSTLFNKSMVIVCSKDSYAEEYAKKYKFNCKYI